MRIQLNLTLSTIFLLLLCVMIAHASGCAKDRRPGVGPNRQPIGWALGLQADGTITGDPFHVLDDKELKVDIDRICASHSQFEIFLQIADSSNTPVLTVTRAVLRIESFIPLNERKKISIRITTPFNEPSVHYLVR